MRIRYFADIRFPLERANGVQTMETCHALARRGHDVRLTVRPDTARPPRNPFTYYGLEPIPQLRIDQVAVPSNPAARRGVYLAQACWRAMGTAGADVVLTRDLTLATLIVRVPRAVRPALVYESHGYAPAVGDEQHALLSGARSQRGIKRRRLEARERLVWLRADGYVTITKGLAQELEQRFGPRPRLAIVPDGVRAASVTPDDAGAGRHSGTPLVAAYAGHLYPWKGVDVFLHALHQLPHVHGLIVGGLDGEPDVTRVRALADLLAPGRVVCAGLVDPPRVAPLLRQADVLVLPNLPTRISAVYTSPLKLFEYMAAGRPIVASDLPALREVLRPEENAILVEAGNAGALAAGIERVAADPALARRLARQASMDAAGYTWERRAERLEALLTEAAGRRA